MTIFSGVGSSGSVGPTSGGRVSAFNNISTTPQPVLNIAASRVSVTFHNPGTQTIYIAPATVIPYAAQGISTPGTVLTPSLAALGGCFQLFPGGVLQITGECQIGWQAFAAANANNPLTVMSSHI